MKRSVSIAALKVMSSPRQEDAVAELIKSTRRAPNGEIADLDNAIRAFEEKHGMGSTVMRTKVADGTLSETAEICAWLGRH